MATATSPRAAEAAPNGLPDTKVSLRETFGIDSDLAVPAFSAPT